MAIGRTRLLMGPMKIQHRIGISHGTARTKPQSCFSVAIPTWTGHTRNAPDGQRQHRRFDVLASERNSKAWPSMIGLSRSIRITWP